ncbi:MAG: hypothetical protein JNK82_42275 [Myxococcaceae bacterium]|nr:hypothetical protein [Myxococcaceae bacterium]
MLFAVIAALLAQEPPPFETTFDPGRGLELRAGGSALGLAPGADFGLSLRLRGDRDSRSKAGTSWLHAHRLVMADARAGPGQRQLSLAAYEGIARRHVDDGSLLLPTSPPLRLPFPLDLGLYARIARYERRVEDGLGWSLETARVAMLFDPLRSGSGRFHLGFGPSLAHVLRHDGAVLHNELTPLTALQLFVSLESDDGLWVFRSAGQAGFTFDPAALQTGGTFRARGEVTLERVLLAVNDHPVSLQLRASGAFRDAGALSANEWSAGGALKVQLFAHR